MESRGEDAVAIQVMTRLHRIGGQKKEWSLLESGWSIGDFSGVAM